MKPGATLAILFALAVTAYAPALGYELVWDDVHLVSGSRFLADRRVGHAALAARAARGRRRCRPAAAPPARPGRARARPALRPGQGAGPAVPPVLAAVAARARTGVVARGVARARAVVDP